MTTGNTTLLGLALPVDGELDGTWGDVVNDSITSLVDSAVAGTTTLSTDADVTLTDTVLSANQARQAVLLWTASNGATTRNITAPARSKPYIVINAGTGSIVLRGAGPTTGITIVSGEKCLAAWNGSDFVKVASTAISNLTGTLPVANGGTGATTNTSARTNLGATTLGANLFTIANPSAVTFPQFNADNTVSALNAADFRTAIGAGTATGTVTSVGGTGTVNGITLSGTVTSTGNLTLGGALSGVSLETQVTGTLPVANGGTGATTLTANNVLLGNGTSALQVVAPGTSGNVLTSNGTTWQSVAAPVANIIRVARTSNTALTSANKGNLIDITSGTFSQTFDACASLGNGWFCYIQNSGTGDITLDPNGSETIDGLTTFVMYPGEVRLVQCDGTALRTIVLNAFFRTFTASGTFTRPPGYAAFQGLIWGAGGSGGKSNSNGGGGGGGGCTPFVLPNASVGASVTVTIAAASTGPSVNGNGVNGGNSTFGSLATGYGGAGGYFDGSSNTFGGGGGGVLGAAAQSNSAQGGQPSIAPGVSNASVNVGFGGGNGSTSAGGAAVYGGAGGGGASGAGGSSLYGGGGGGGRNSGAAGASVYGGTGGAGATSLSGGDGTAPGGGGGGTETGTKAGNGARGELRIWGVI